MSSSNVLKEFLVKIGFKVDETKFRNFQESMRATAKNAAEMGKTLLAASTVGGASLTKLSRQMETLYFASQRTGSSARELKEFSFAATQIGVSAEQAQGAIEGLAAARRTNPGLNGLLGSMGIDPKQTDNAKVLVQLLAKLHSMPHYQGAQVAALFGIDEGTFNQLETHLPELQKYLAMRERMFRQAGINPDDMAKRGHEFSTKLRTFEAETGALADIIAYRLVPAGEKVIGWLESMVNWLIKADTATNGWSSKILGVASALAGGSLLKGGLGIVGRLFGGGGGAAVAEGSGAAASAGGLAGLVGTILTTGLIAALAVAVFGIIKPEAVAKMLGLDPHGHQITDAIKKPFVAAAHAVQGMHKQIQATGGYVKNLSAMPGAIGGVARAAGSLTTMVAKFEGHFKNGYGVYKDVAGHLTAGFGHLVKPGENFSNLDKASALQLLAKDLGTAVSTVSRMVKVHLSHNQADALADFVFNVGGDKFAHSTLLKKLNSGDFAGAADQFQYWNKVMSHGHLITNGGLAARRSAEANLFRAPDKTTTITQHADIHVEGVKNPHEAGRAAGEATNHAFSSMLRNMKNEAPA